jgi:anti-sigma B factor antagonist
MTELAKFEVSAAANRAGDTAAGGKPAALLKIVGEVDVATSPQLELELVALLKAGNSHVVIDMAEVDFIDASGIGTLVTAADQARSAGGDLVLSRPTSRVRRVIDVLQLNGALPVVRGYESTD